MSRRCADRGSASLELVLLTPAIVVGWLFVVWAGRVVHDQHRVSAAAERGARAASMASETRRTTEASAAVLDEVGGLGAGCISPTVVVTSGADSVRVDVGCRLDLAGIPIFGSRLFTASASSPIDHYRVP